MQSSINDITGHLWTFPKWQETISISTLHLTSLPTVIGFANL